MNKRLHQCFLVVAALVLNILFFMLNNHEYHAITQAHGQVGYHLYTYNTLYPSCNPQLTDYLNQHKAGRSQLVDMSVVRNGDLGPPTQPFPVNDTIGYGIVLGLLWKLTGSLNFVDAQTLQIIIFSLLMILIYQIALMLFGSADYAFACGIALLLFFPLIALNVQAVRDIWAYYGLVFLIYGLLSYWYRNSSIIVLILWLSLFACCQFVRPSVFLAVLTAAGVLILAGLLQKQWQKSLCALIVLALTNFLFFWVPFFVYNITAYNRLLVGPVGQDLLEGLGEFDNPWGHRLSDEYVAHLIETKSGFLYGTPGFDDAARAEFMHAYQENPWLYYRNILKRLPHLVLPGLPWIYYAQSPYKGCTDIAQKMWCIVLCPWLWFDFLLRHVYIRLYILLAYLGLGILLVCKRYDVVLIILAVLAASTAKLPSHIEYRYLIPFYWVLCFAFAASFFPVCRR